MSLIEWWLIVVPYLVGHISNYSVCDRGKVGLENKDRKRKSRKGSRKRKNKGKKKKKRTRVVETFIFYLAVLIDFGEEQWITLDWINSLVFWGVVPRFLFVCLYFANSVWRVSSQWHLSYQSLSLTSLIYHGKRKWWAFLSKLMYDI